MTTSPLALRIAAGQLKFLDDRAKTPDELVALKLLFEDEEVALVSAGFPTESQTYKVLFNKEHGTVLTSEYQFWYVAEPD